MAKVDRARNRSDLRCGQGGGSWADTSMGCASHFRDVVGGDAGAAACEGDAGAACGVAGARGVAVATRTVSPAVRVSGGLSMIRSDGDRPAMISTLSPRSRPSCTFLTTTLLLLSRVATWVP